MTHTLENCGSVLATAEHRGVISSAFVRGILPFLVLIKLLQLRRYVFPDIVAWCHPYIRLVSGVSNPLLISQRRIESHEEKG